MWALDSRTEIRNGCTAKLPMRLHTLETNCDEFGYSRHSAVTKRLICIKIIDSHAQKIQLQGSLMDFFTLHVNKIRTGTGNGTGINVSWCIVQKCPHRSKTEKNQNSLFPTVLAQLTLPVPVTIPCNVNKTLQRSPFLTEARLSLVA